MIELSGLRRWETPCTRRFERVEAMAPPQHKALLEKMFSEADPDWDKKPDIKWNFTKFVVDRDGNVVARFEPTADIDKVEACIKTLL